MLARWGRAPKPGSSPMPLLSPRRTSMGEELWEPRTLAGSISRGILPVPPCKKKKKCQKGLRASAGRGVPAILLPQHPRT